MFTMLIHCWILETFQFQFEKSSLLKQFSFLREFFKSGKLVLIKSHAHLVTVAYITNVHLSQKRLQIKLRKVI